VETWVRQAFEIEDLSWKGQVGSSVLRTPGMLDFFLGQAKQLAEWGHLELALLRLDGRAISFVYGCRAKGVSHWLKIGYDPEYRCSTPGQLLQFRILERHHQEGDCRAIDCLGPLTDALSKWNPATYPVGRLVIAPRQWRGRMAVYACKHWWPTVRRWLGRSELQGPERGQCQQSPDRTIGQVPAKV
jgi:CelD/BcsL family acetyltransferase involved in cellulose biosynthesis